MSPGGGDRAGHNPLGRGTSSSKQTTKGACVHGGVTHGRCCWVGAGVGSEADGGWGWTRRSPVVQAA